MDGLGVGATGVGSRQTRRREAGRNSSGGRRHKMYTFMRGGSAMANGHEAAGGERGVWGSVTLMRPGNDEAGLLRPNVAGRPRAWEWGCIASAWCAGGKRTVGRGRQRRRCMIELAHVVMSCAKQPV